MKEVTIHEESVVKPLLVQKTSFGLMDFFRYFQLFEEVFAVFNSLKGMAVGADVTIPDLKVHIGAEHFTWHPGVVHRDS
ncbi:MAG TPA: hypothetical protein VEP90_18730 [Methylomirabilota bacterium]|nr:hypothetical protein [Methylomirabilota bacterium]